MRQLSSSETLTLWERGASLHPLDLGLLALSFAGASPSEVADWTLGRRNRELLELYGRWFGAQLEAWSSCPKCGEHVEFDLDIRDLLQAQPEGTPHRDSINVGQYVFRLPTSRDVAEIACVPDQDAAALQLLERCLISGDELSGCSADFVEDVGKSLAKADPLAETRLALACPSCDTVWDASLEVASFLWTELESRARRLLWEVHSLASAYHWSESESLALSPARRAMYLEMVGA